MPDVALSEEDIGGFLAGAGLGGGIVNVIAVATGGDASWLLFAAGAVVGAPLGYRYADRLWRWWWVWWQ